MLFEKKFDETENPIHDPADQRNSAGSDGEGPVRKSFLTLSQEERDSGTQRREKPPVDYTGVYAVILLFLVGCFSGVLVNIVLWGSAMLSLMQMKLLISNPAGPFCLMLTTAALAGLSAFVCKKSGRVATIGSGIPEVKALLTNEFHPTELAMIVSSRIGYTRMVAMVMSLGAGLSIGSAAPLVHMTVCNAYTIMKLSPDFGSLLENSNMMRQIFNASAAAGMAACFNCPLGGVLFSIEVTSSYYLLANYWRSFMAATAGAVLFSMILWARGIEISRPFQLTYIADPYKHWELPLYLLLGLVCAVASYLYLHLQQRWFLFIRKYSVAQPVLIAAIVGAFTALMTFALRAYTPKGVTAANMVNDVLKSGDVTELTSYNDVSRIGGVFASLLIRVILTVLATTLRIPAGFFTPMILIGAMIGRIFGLIVQNMAGPGATIYVGGYALVGACAFASGTTHTISAAVVMLESTGQLEMFLPCLIGAIVGSGFVKGHTVSLYNQGLINKGLESFEQLLQESGDFHSAKDMMDAKVVYVQRKCQVGDLLTLMENAKLATFPVIDNIESCKLIGSISRKDVYQYLKKFYSTHGLVAFVRQMMPEDTKQDDYRIARALKMEARTQWLRTQIVLPSEVADEEASNAAAAQRERTGSFSMVTSPFAGMAGGSSHGPNGGTGNGVSNAVYSSAPTAPSNRRVIYADGFDEEQGNVSDEDDQDDSPHSGSGTSFNSRSSFSASTYGIELTPQGAAQRETTPSIQSGSGPAPTAIQIQAMINSKSISPSNARAKDAGSELDKYEASLSRAPGAPVSPPTSPSSGATTDAAGNKFSVVNKITSVMKANKTRKALLAFMTKDEEARAQLLLKHTIDIQKEKLLPLNVDPFTVHMSSPVDQVYMIFNSVKVNCVFVVEEDLVLQGMISQEHLMQKLKKKKG